MSKNVLPIFSSMSFIVSGLTFRSLIYFVFIFVYGVRKYSDFILLHVAVQFTQHHLLKRLSLPNKRHFTDSSVHGILHARILEWVAILFSKGSSQPRDWTQASPLQANSLPSEPPQKPRLFIISPFSLRVLWFHFSIAMFCSFIKFKAFFANWSTINLQCCVSFNSTAKWFGFICIFFRLFSSIDYTRKNLNFYLFYILEADTHTVISEGSERQYW